MSIAVLHPGSRMSYAIPVILFKSGLLFKTYTDFFLPSSVSNPLINISEILNFNQISKYLQSRSSEFLPSSFVKSCYFDSLQIWMSRNESSSFLYKRLTVEVRLVKLISEIVCRDKENFNAFYSFISGSLEAFELMNDKIKILDIMHPPHEFLIPYLREEYSKFTDWVNIEDPYADGSEDLLIKREQKELAMADVVIAPSHFVMNALNKISQAEKKVYLNPYPRPLWVEKYIPKALEYRKPENNLLRILFAGTVNLRKGIQYLLPALSLLSKLNIESRIIGSIHIFNKMVTKYENICQFKGGISKSELAQEYQWADLFVFPSVAEGSAGVVYEAMSFGLPVITTFASGSVVRDGLDGFVLQQPSSELIAEKIHILYKDRELLQEMSVNSFARSKEFSLEQSGNRLSNLITSTLPLLQKN